MSDRFEVCAARPLRDVAVTTGARVEVTSWAGHDDSIGWVVHPCGSRPTRPFWETFWLLAGADSLAMHPPPAMRWRGPGCWDDEDIVLTVAEVAQDMVQMLLWEQGLDPTWPPCPTHPGAHPLRLDRSIVWSGTTDAPAIEQDTGAQWVCRQNGSTVSVGFLA